MKTALMALVVYMVSPVIIACTFTGILPWELFQVIDLQHLFVSD